MEVSALRRCCDGDGKCREKKKKLRTPLGETLVVVTHTDEREDGGG